MKRLTDPKVAEVLKKNIEALQKVGIEPSISELRYIKLSDYEDKEEFLAHRVKDDSEEYE